MKWIIACVVVLILGQTAEFNQSDLVQTGLGHLSLIGKIGYSLALLSLGILLTPVARSADHKRVASESVERLHEMRRSVVVVSATVNEAVSEVKEDMQLKLLTAKIELENYPDILLKTMHDWEDVVPTVVKDVSERSARRQEMLETMDRGQLGVGN